MQHTVSFSEWYNSSIIQCKIFSKILLKTSLLYLAMLWQNLTVTPWCHRCLLRRCHNTKGKSLGSFGIFHQYITNNRQITDICKRQRKLEQLERLGSEDTPHRPMITHTIDQFILNPKSILLTSSYRIPSQNKVKAEIFLKNCEF